MASETHADNLERIVHQLAQGLPPSSSDTFALIEAARWIRENEGKDSDAK